MHGLLAGAFELTVLDYGSGLQIKVYDPSWFWNRLGTLGLTQFVEFLNLFGGSGVKSRGSHISCEDRN